MLLFTHTTSEDGHFSSIQCDGCNGDIYIHHTFNADISKVRSCARVRSRRHNHSCNKRAKYLKHRLTADLSYAFSRNAYKLLTVTFVFPPPGILFVPCSISCSDPQWNTSNVVEMTVTFAGASQFNVDISNWDTGKVVSTAEMFYAAENFVSILRQFLSKNKCDKCTDCVLFRFDLYRRASFDVYHRPYKSC